MRSPGSRPSSRPRTEGRRLRVLQLLADTDGGPANRRALDAHRSLVALGVEVRTLALAPGRTAALADLVPVLAPSPHGFAARTAVRAELGWADVALLRGVGSLGRATLRPLGVPPPVVVDLCDLDEREREPSRAARQLLTRAARVVLRSESDRRHLAAWAPGATVATVVLASGGGVEPWAELLADVVGDGGAPLT